MAFIVEHVKSLLQRDLLTEFGKSKDKYNCQVKAVPLPKSASFLNILTVFKTVCRYLLVERDIPDGCSGKALVLR